MLGVIPGDPGPWISLPGSWVRAHTSTPRTSGPVFGVDLDVVVGEVAGQDLDPGLAPAEGDVQAAIPKRIRPAKGEIYTRVENPRGELGYYLISDGSANPFRLKVRGPSFVNLSVIDEISRGHLIADLVAILGSVDIVLGEVDR